MLVFTHLFSLTSAHPSIRHPPLCAFKDFYSLSSIPRPHCGIVVLSLSVTFDTRVHRTSQCGFLLDQRWACMSWWDTESIFQDTIFDQQTLLIYRWTISFFFFFIQLSFCLLFSKQAQLTSALWHLSLIPVMYCHFNPLIIFIISLWTVPKITAIDVIQCNCIHSAVISNMLIISVAIEDVIAQLSLHNVHHQKCSK